MSESLISYDCRGSSPEGLASRSPSLTTMTSASTASLSSSSLSFGRSPDAITALLNSHGKLISSNYSQENSRDLITLDMLARLLLLECLLVQWSTIYSITSGFFKLQALPSPSTLVLLRLSRSRNGPSPQLRNHNLAGNRVQWGKLPHKTLVCPLRRILLGMMPPPPGMMPLLPRHNQKKIEQLRLKRVIFQVLTTFFVRPSEQWFVACA